jgi:hypothetical protein
MKFFKPQIQLAREAVLDGPDVFFLHVTTFCSSTNYRANGHTVSEARLASDGLYAVTVKLQQDANLPDMGTGYITPVVHVIRLGAINFPGGEGLIEVTVEGAVTTGNGRAGDPKTTTKTGGTGTVSTTDSETITRPILEDRLT